MRKGTEPRRALYMARAARACYPDAARRFRSAMTGLLVFHFVLIERIFYELHLHNPQMSPPGLPFFLRFPLSL